MDKKEKEIILPIKSDELFKKIVKDESTIDSFTDVLNYSTTMNRELYIGDIDDETGSEVDTIIRFWNRVDDENEVPVEEREPIKLYIDSWGGSLSSGFSIIDAIELSKTPVHTIVTGAAYSCGFLIALSGHKRYGYKHSSYLFHEGSAANAGTANQFQNFTEFYRKQLKQMEDHILSHTKITTDKYKEIKKDDWWLESADAIEYGIIDEIME